MQRPSTDETIAVADLMETPEGRDEYGTPDECIAECDDCGTLFRRGGAHRCENGEWVSDR